jgi:hypothetical protein
MFTEKNFQEQLDRIRKVIDEAASNAKDLLGCIDGSPSIGLELNLTCNGVIVQIKIEEAE